MDPSSDGSKPKAAGDDRNALAIEPGSSESFTRFRLVQYDDTDSSSDDDAPQQPTPPTESSSATDANTRPQSIFQRRLIEEAQNKAHVKPEVATQNKPAETSRSLMEIFSGLEVTIKNTAAPASAPQTNNQPDPPQATALAESSSSILGKRKPSRPSDGTEQPSKRPSPAPLALAPSNASPSVTVKTESAPPKTSVPRPAEDSKPIPPAPLPSNPGVSSQQQQQYPQGFGFSGGTRNANQTSPAANLKATPTSSSAHTTQGNRAPPAQVHAAQGIRAPPAPTQTSAIPPPRPNQSSSCAASQHASLTQSATAAYHDSRVYCNVCSRYFVDRLGYDQHRRDSTAHFYCYLCDREFSNDHALWQHRKNSSAHYDDYNDQYYDNDEDKDDPYCGACRQEFRNMDDLEDHEMFSATHYTNIGRDPYCYYCRREFATLSALYQHFENSWAHGN